MPAELACDLFEDHAPNHGVLQRVKRELAHPLALEQLEDDGFLHDSSILARVGPGFYYAAFSSSSRRSLRFNSSSRAFSLSVSSSPCWAAMTSSMRSPW